MPLKRIALSFAGQRVRGEAVVTATGIEGGAVYALSAPLRDAIAAQGEAVLHIDLRPDLAIADLARRLAMPRGKQSMSTFLRKAASAGARRHRPAARDRARGRYAARRDDA